LRTPTAPSKRCVDTTRSTSDGARDGTDLLVSVTEVPSSFDVTAFDAGLERATLEPTPSRTRPFERIREATHRLGSEERLLPRRWERIGEVVLLRPPTGVQWGDAAPRVAAVYGETLGAKTVVEDLASMHRRFAKSYGPRIQPLVLKTMIVCA
jgi:tRNA G37 N-methylase Trm5